MKVKIVSISFTVFIFKLFVKSLGDDLGSFIEFYYSYDVNDSLTITPGIAFTMRNQDPADLVAEGNDLAFYLYDRTAIGVGATFKF